ncbi:MAG: hypothetical protein ACJAYB_000067 [Psychromonas sp.]|jgi:hypothetical protein
MESQKKIAQDTKSFNRTCKSYKIKSGKPLDYRPISTQQKKLRMIKFAPAAIRVSIVIGTALTIANQYSAIFGNESIDKVAAAVTYLAPFLVSMYSAMAQAKKSNARIDW